MLTVALTHREGRLHLNPELFFSVSPKYCGLRFRRANPLRVEARILFHKP